MLCARRILQNGPSPSPVSVLVVSAKMQRQFLFSVSKLKIKFWEMERDQIHKHTEFQGRRRRIELYVINIIGFKLFSICRTFVIRWAGGLAGPPLCIISTAFIRTIKYSLKPRTIKCRKYFSLVLQLCFGRTRKQKKNDRGAEAEGESGAAHILIHNGMPFYSIYTRIIFCLK